jgi:hypothetical protein
MQFSKAVKGLTQVVTHSDQAYGPCKLYKANMSDRFYPIDLSTSGLLKLAVLMPAFLGMPPLVAIPLVLPMGCTDSPPFFSMFAERVCDLTNKDLCTNKCYPAHPLGNLAGAKDFCDNKESGPVVETKRSTPWSHIQKIARKPTSCMYVFVDDFCGAGQDPGMNPLTNQHCTLFHNIDKVF